ncbi:uncharacterized protein LOC124253317 [Haliotis rubra]|uniref:uncharacterized protein LOC124253317 n=1 Tax=Haliotis rubra TaxID=36100 RepID=UPI001EE5BD52|nr:uncharacterized protein LOC124253317 [Haliotis rubra]
MLHIDSIFSAKNESHRDETLNLLLNERISKTGKREVDRWKSGTGTADDVNIGVQSVLKETRQRDKGKYAKHNTMCLRSRPLEQIRQNMTVKGIRFSRDHFETMTESITLSGKPCGTG